MNGLENKYDSVVGLSRYQIQVQVNEKPYYTLLEAR